MQPFLLPDAINQIFIQYLTHQSVFPQFNYKYLQSFLYMLKVLHILEYLERLLLEIKKVSSMKLPTLYLSVPG